MGGWWQRFRERRRVRRVLGALFERDDVLANCSLRADHRTRADLRDYELDGERVAVVYFTVLRHPRPYAFSQQRHEVMELYRYDVEAGEVTVHDSINLTRLRNRDG